MPPSILIVNHWGGVPAALHGNVVDMQRRWATFARERVALTTTNPTREFDVATTTAFRALKANGYDTFCLGATGFVGGRRRDDPRRRLARSKGIDVCSLYDGAAFVGPSIVHDESVIKEATDVVFNRDVTSPPFVLCVNLLSCRHVVGVGADEQDDDDDDSIGINEGGRTAAALKARAIPRARVIARGVGAAAATAAATAPTRPPFDDVRMLPPSLGVHIAGISMHASTRDEYMSLVFRGLDALEAIEAAVVALVDRMRQCNGVVVMTSTHALSLGEHGVVGSHAPTASCTQTFWCSSVLLPTSLPTLRDHVHALVAACGVPLTFAPTLTTVVTTVHEPGNATITTNKQRPVGDSTPLTSHPSSTSSILSTLKRSEPVLRVTSKLYDHAYVCVGNYDRFFVVFDTCDDVFETRDVSALIPHLLLKLCTTYESAVHSAPRADDDDETASVSTFASVSTTDDDVMSSTGSDDVVLNISLPRTSAEASSASVAIRPKQRHNNVNKKRKVPRRAIIVDSSCTSIKGSALGRRSIPEEDVRAPSPATHPLTPSAPNDTVGTSTRRQVPPPHAAPTLPPPLSRPRTSAVQYADPTGRPEVRSAVVVEYHHHQQPAPHHSELNLSMPTTAVGRQPSWASRG